MPVQTKLATCSYCGARTLLKLTARDGHELACGSCGAPLHELKWLKAPEPKAKSVQERKERKVKPARPAEWPASYKPRKKRKRRKSLTSKLFEEVWDVVEDIFD